jgi:hypothetical protein
MVLEGDVPWPLYCCVDIFGSYVCELVSKERVGCKERGFGARDLSCGKQHADGSEGKDCVCTVVVVLVWCGAMLEEDQQTRGSRHDKIRQAETSDNTDTETGTGES